MSKPLLRDSVRTVLSSNTLDSSIPKTLVFVLADPHDYGRKYKTCYRCGENTTTKDILKCDVSTMWSVIPEKYEELTKKEGPQYNMKSAEEKAEAIRRITKERSRIQQVMDKFVR